MMLMEILGALASPAIGGIIGGIAAYFNRKLDIQVKRIDHEQEEKRWSHELKLRDSDLAIAKAEADGKAEIAKIEGDALFDSERAKAIAKIDESSRVTADEIKAAGKLGWMLVLVSAWQKAVRPTVAVVFIAASLLMNFLLLKEFDLNTLTPAQKFELMMQAVYWIGGQAGLIVGFYYVNRGAPTDRPVK